MTIAKEKRPLKVPWKLIRARHKNHPSAPISLGHIRASSYLAPEKKSLEEVSRVPLTAPKVEQATKIGMNQEYLPYIRLANVTATASDLEI